MPGEPSETLDSGGPTPVRTLDRLRVLQRALERDRDSLSAWTELADLFAELADDRRSHLCESIARNLRRLPAA